MIKVLNLEYSNELAEVLSTDEKLHRELSPKSKMVSMSGQEYMQGCKNWEIKKNGKCFVIIKDEHAVGSISFVHKDDETVSVGYWIKSDLWGMGICTEAFKDMLLLLKNAGYIYVTASILKENSASKRLWERYHATMREDDERYYPLIKL